VTLMKSGRLASVLLISLAGVLSPVAAGGEDSRLLWKVEVDGLTDRFVELCPAGDKLIVVRKGVLYAHDVATGKQLWRFPEKGTACRYMGMNRTWPFIRGVFGDCLVTILTSRDRYPGAGLLFINLADGRLKHSFRFGKDAPNFTASKYVDPGWTQPAGKHMAFSTCDNKRERFQVSVIDLESRSEVSRFDFPIISYRSGLRVVGDLILGGVREAKNKPLRIFSLNMKTGEFFGVRARGGYPRGLVRHVMPDGSQVIPEGLISSKGAYVRPWPKAELTRQFAGALYVRDERSLYRADPQTGKAMWRLPLPYYRSYSYRERDLNCRVASKDILAYYEDGLIYVLSTTDGKLRAVIPALSLSVMSRSHSGRDTITAWDSKRVYFSCIEGLRVFSTRQVDPAKPDPTDSGDPAGYLARTRAALSADNNEKALDAIRGIGVAIRLRPAQRREAAGLLSQLARSPASRKNPRPWQKILLADGPLAGGLFLSDFQRTSGENPAATSALIDVGTPTALAAAARIVLGKYKRGYTLPMAIEAIRISTKKDATEKVAATSGLRGWLVMQLLVDGPMDEATFRRRLPQMRACIPTKPRAKNETRMSWGRNLRFLLPEQAAAVVELSKRDDAIYYREACLEQAESMKRGEGVKKTIEITKSKAKKPPEVF
jgi:outer membrane protein assembly factor BamB